MKYAYVLDALNSRTHWAQSWKLTWIKSVHGQLRVLTNNKIYRYTQTVMKLKLKSISLLRLYDILDLMFEARILRLYWS